MLGRSCCQNFKAVGQAQVELRMYPSSQIVGCMYNTLFANLVTLCVYIFLYINYPVYDTVVKLDYS